MEGENQEVNLTVDSKEPIIQKRGVTRRGFLKAALAAGALAVAPTDLIEAAASAVSDTAPKSEKTASKEKLPLIYPPALIIDVPPLADGVKSLQEKGLS